MILYLLSEDQDSPTLYSIISHVYGGPFYYTTPQEQFEYPGINFYHDFWSPEDTEIRTVCSLESCIEVEPLWGQLMWEHDPEI